MLSQMGLQVAQGLGAFAQSRITSDLETAYKKYRNVMSALSAAQEQNNVVLNSIAIRDASIAEQEQIEIAAIREQGSAQVSAAAAGVKGNSVDLTMRSLAADAARANKTRLDNLNNQFTALNGEKRNIQVAAVMNKDISVIPRASVATTLLGMGTQLINTWDSHQTPGEKITDRLSR